MLVPCDLEAALTGGDPRTRSVPAGSEPGSTQASTGTEVPTEAVSASSDPEIAELRDELRAAGLLRRRPLYAWVRITATFLLVAAGWVAFVLVGNSWWQLLTAVYLAVMFTQVGFVGHDVGHRQVSGSRALNDLLGMLHANLLIGVSYSYWVDKHNQHHAHPNQVGRDPDVAVGAIAWTPEQASTGRWPRRMLARSQGALFFPMTFLEAANLHYASAHTLRRRSCRHRLLEQGLLAAHVVGYLAAVLLVLSPARAAAFVVVQQGLFGFYLGCSFAPNHKGMPILAADCDEGFVRRQVLTARNLTGGWLTGLAVGGLNYQIEHHLFPAMARSNLRHAQPFVRAFCERHHLAYTECSPLASYLQTVRHLHQVARSGQVAPAGRLG